MRKRRVVIIELILIELVVVLVLQLALGLLPDRRHAVEGLGNGTVGGRGTGSGGGTHDYVSVPNKLGNDSSITKDKGDSKNSDYYKAKNGLAWKGEHVDLDSVVGDYTKEAYEGIANGKYPAGMEDVIRNYFENLN